MPISTGKRDLRPIGTEKIGTKKKPGGKKKGERITHHALGEKKKTPRGSTTSRQFGQPQLSALTGSVMPATYIDNQQRQEEEKVAFEGGATVGEEKVLGRNVIAIPG